MFVINETISINLTEFEFSYVRSPGPGGQNVNKVNSKALLKWSIDRTNVLPAAVKNRFRERFHRRISKDGYFTISSHRYRDQGRNTADCLSKLRDLILEIYPEPITRKPTKVSKAAKRRRVDAKRRQAEKKHSRSRPGSDD